MSRFFPVLTLVLAIAGAIIGWNSVPHYRAPADNGEARLRERAAEYYRASRLFDSLTMAQLYTPAKQLTENDKLLKASEKHQVSFDALDESNKKNLHISAESITAGSLEVEVEGDWATTWGTCDYPTGATTVPISLQKMVWIKTGGDWWIYTWRKPEIAAYGNPPDDSYYLLRKRRNEENRQLALEMQEAQRQGAQTESPVADEAGSKSGEDAPQQDTTPEPKDGE